MLNVLDKLLKYVDNSISSMPTGSRKIALGRSLIAASQISLLIFTDWKSLFVPVDKNPYGPKCEGISNIGAYCLLFDYTGIEFPSILLIIGLIFVLTGFYPRYAGFLHLWITLSISSSIKLPDGGEAVAQIVVAFLAIISLSDRRLNHWNKDSFENSFFQPASWAASHVLRIQLVWIYINASIAKTAVPEWKDGTAVYYISLDPMFGTSGPFAFLFDWMAGVPVISLGMTWGAIVIELLIAYFLLGTSKNRPFSFWLALFLHVSFIFMIGLWSFAIIMIGSVLVATGPNVYIRDIFRPSFRKLRGGLNA
ncbi:MULTISPECIES: sporulation-delaying protein SdpB family protein [Bacillati]|uniref:sporulation-delaying protein SdpB family protein n=1 Tax=Bacillati TaxID=1783272 RepID=UPI001F1D08B8|nr:sporulation-delaying protein SdpB family protein [Rothia nasisuis]MDO4252909.1 hypothetical protein [Rothia sp. (in: high G+C Gram-positive bacteria)]